jgi:hypothetical protein
MKNSNSRSLQYDLGENRLERAARIAAVKNLEIKKIETHGPLNKKDAEKQANKDIINKKDGRIAKIPVNTVGKILGHQGYDVSKIYDSLPYLYETSILAFSEHETKKEGKNTKTNISKFHHYINKFSDGISAYYIRITLYEEKSRTKKGGRNLIHSTAISDIEIYKNGEDLQRIRGMYPGEAKSTPFIDSKIIEFFNSVKPDSVLKIVDENGEQEERKSTGKVHSAHISEVEVLNEKSREDRSLPGLDLGGTAQPAYDESLVDFFNSVNNPQKSN